MRGRARPRHRHARRRGVVLAIAGLAVVAAGTALAMWVLARPRLELVARRNALAGMELTGLGGRMSQVGASVGGHRLPVEVDGGRIVPKVRVAPGTRVTVEATLREPGWISWITGRRVRTSVQTTAPSSRLAASTVSVGSGRRVTATFDTPVAKVAVSGPTGRRVIAVDPPSKTVPVTGRLPVASAGEVTVAAVASPWESLPRGSVLTYFAASRRTPVALIPDGAGAPVLTTDGPIEIRLSRPVSSVFGSAVPTLTPTITGVPAPEGTWTRPTPDVLEFLPSGPTFWPGEKITVTLPARVAVVVGGGHTTDPATAITLDGPPSSVLRLQQLLATLNYLPLAWEPAAGASDPTTLAGQAALIDDPQPGTFAWRWSMPSALTAQWAQGAATAMTTGAVMSFEDVEGLNYGQTPLQNPLLWPTLLKAVLTKQVDPRPYVWVEVSETLPERLWLWSDGSVVLTNLTNTGIPSTPTTPGTYPVYLRYAQNYMSGFNPTGSYYHDLVHWIAYFNGSQAVHGFPRASYGFPQSLGCVELPVGGGDSVARTVWPYDRIGTLVTILTSGASTTAPG